MQRDDGAVVYLNGAEVLRTNLPTGTITATNLATATVSGRDETNWFRAHSPGMRSTNGLNVIAVEVHQAAANSSDLGFDLELSAALQPRLTITRSKRASAALACRRAGLPRAIQHAVSSTNWLLQAGTPAFYAAIRTSLQLSSPASRFYRLVSQ